MYKCKYCGKEFEKKQQLAGHMVWCSKNPNRNGKSGFIKYKPTKVSQIRKIDIPNDNLFCKYCGKQCKSINSLKQHEIRCKENPTRKCFNRFQKLNENIQLGIVSIWNKGESKKTNKSVLQQSKKLHEKYVLGEYTSPNKGIKHSEEYKNKVSETMRVKTAEYLKNCFPNGCRYNKKACKYIDKINQEFGWNLQHAENGGEVQICGFFLDGYDKERNIVFEYDENQHYIDVYNNILSDKDVKRQKIIIETLGCKFVRYNEELDMLYEVK